MSLCKKGGKALGKVLGSEPAPPMSFEKSLHSFGFVLFSASYPGVAVSGGYATCTDTPKPQSSFRIESPKPRMAHLVGAYDAYLRNEKRGNRS
jgi:hypothetical protein